MFAAVDLGARIERAEVALIDAIAVSIAERRSAVDVRTVPLGGGIAIVSEAGSPLNKVAGLGFGGEVDEDALAEVEALCAARGIPVQVELASLGDPAVGTMLTRRGYSFVGVENVLGCAPSAAVLPPASTAVVTPSPLAELDPWVATLAQGFATPDTQGIASHEHHDAAVLERVMRDFVTSAGIVRYAARIDTGLVGGATARFHDGVAQLCGAATLAPWRRRGTQSALLAARLRDAATAGCDVAVMTVQPGSKSHENAHRRGFRLLYVRSVFVRGA